METKIFKQKGEDLALLRDLSLLFGPTGCEREVAEAIIPRIRPFCHELRRDRMGNLVAQVRCGNENADDRLRVMISAHMDEVGVMVTEITEDGYLRFDTVGGIHPSVLEGRKVTLGDERNRLAGVIASKAIHHKKKKDRNKPTPVEKLVIDIGASTGEEAGKYLSVGSFGVFDSEFYTFGKDDALMKGKALDDRMGCAAMIEVMASLWEDLPPVDADLYFCFTVREEIGLSGAKVVAERLAPHIAIVLESTAVSDLPEVAPAKRVAALSAGGALSVADRATIYDRSLVEFAQRVAKKEEIPLQIKQYVSGGNDAGSIHKTGEGVRTLALSVPTRYLHSPACVASRADYRAVRDLVFAMLREIDGALN